MGTIMVLSVKDDTSTVDESAYIPVGYSYLTLQNMHFNPEHPPLFKDLAALPLLFLDLSSPTEFSTWQNGNQFQFGEDFLYNQKTPPEQIIFLSRLPMILITLLLGFIVFKLTRKFFGYKAGLLALFFFVFSPLILTSGRLVYNDILAGLGAFVALYFFTQFLKERTNKNIIISGITLGLAQLCKFSLVLLFPIFLVFFLFWTIFHIKGSKNTFKFFIQFLSIIAICFLVIFVVYQFHIWNYPEDQQLQDIRKGLVNTRLSNFQFLSYLTNSQVLRAFTQYFFGVSKVFFSLLSSFLGCCYFLGMGAEFGWLTFYPFFYLVKQPIAFHIFTFLALCYFFRTKIKEFSKNKGKNLKLWISHNLFVVANIVWILVYLLTLLTAPSIWERYLLAIYPSIYFLVAGGAIKFLGTFKKKIVKTKIKYIFTALIVWQVISVIHVYPFFTSYFNEFIVKDKDYLYSVGSNVDIGQNARRLARWVDKHGIKKIKIPDRVPVNFTNRKGDIYCLWYYKSYEYYLGAKYEHLSLDGPQKGWMAIPTTLLGYGHAQPAKSKDSWYSNSLYWLDRYEPVEIIGNSIFVYYIE